MAHPWLTGANRSKAHCRIRMGGTAGAWQPALAEQATQGSADHPPRPATAVRATTAARDASGQQGSKEAPQGAAATVGHGFGPLSGDPRPGRGPSGPTRRRSCGPGRRGSAGRTCPLARPGCRSARRPAARADSSCRCVPPPLRFDRGTDSRDALEILALTHAIHAMTSTCQRRVSLPAGPWQPCGASSHPNRIAVDRPGDGPTVTRQGRHSNRDACDRGLRVRQHGKDGARCC
jgi:hypothetical protein